jgi:hypothetical protein
VCRWCFCGCLPVSSMYFFLTVSSTSAAVGSEVGGINGQFLVAASLPITFALVCEALYRLWPHLCALVRRS